MKKQQSPQSEKRKKSSAERERKQAVARIRAKREKIFDASPEKPEFRERKKLFRSRGFRRQYRTFRESGLGVFDACFNALYIVLTERSIDRQKEKLKKEGKEADEAASLEHHGFLLKLFSFFPRMIGGVRRWFRSTDKSGKKSAEHRRFSHLKKYASYYIVSFLALFVIVFVILNLSCPVVLRAEINGELVGIVENKHLVDSAINELEDDVEIILGTSFHFPYEVKYSFERSWTRRLTEKNKISEKLYTYLSDYICTAGGLYVDNVLVAVCKDEEILQNGLDDLVAANAGDGEAGVFNEIRLATQAYPADSVMTDAEYRRLLKEMVIPLDQRKKAPVTDSDVISEILGTDEDEETLPAMVLVSDTEYVPPKSSTPRSNRPASIENVKLDLYTVKYESYDTVIPYQTRYVESASHYTTMADVTTRGVDGKAKVEAKVYFVDGKEVRRDVVSEKITKNPVDRVISIGTKVLPESISPFKGENSFIVPRVGYVSHYYGPRGDKIHSGWDIPGDEGDNVYAAASGRVVVAIGPDGFFAENTANHYSGYGYCIVIEHPNGFRTMYAHCNDIHVTLGQEVKQGEKIGDVGNTGRSDGDHVHFEVILNGQRVDPAPYMYSGNKTIYD